tara:strand:+ start:192 stop:464 length:273 start_codon:yes stop_codon:yes gene_type:complete
MSLNQRRPTGTHINNMVPVKTKVDLEDWLSESGWFLHISWCEGLRSYSAFEKKRGDKGHRNFELGRFDKGETRDWQNMADYFENEVKNYE